MVRLKTVIIASSLFQDLSDVLLKTITDVRIHIKKITVSCAYDQNTSRKSSDHALMTGTKSVPCSFK